jgi:acid phosphatase (class A)
MAPVPITRPAVLLAVLTLTGAGDVAAQSGTTAAAPPAPLAGTTGAPRRVGYLTPGTAPDILRVLPPPPAEGDVRDTADLAVFRSTRRFEGSARWTMAQRDNAVGTPALLQAFSCALDAVISPADAPALMRLLSQSSVDAGASSTSAKNAWKRKRPYQRETGAVCLAQPEIERLTNASPDYPSGHATAAWMTGRLLAEVAPNRATEILERARMFGESRVVCGVHHMTAVDAGRLTAESVLSALHAVPAFRSDLDAAREEVSRLRYTKPDPQACAADAAALAERPY